MAVPTFKDIPEFWKYPYGPYRQAPPEYGGQWWLVNPFTAPGGIMPWVLASGKANPPEEVLPSGFEEIFGPRPRSQEFHDQPNPSLAFRVATVSWEQDLKYFKQAGLPEWAETEQVRLAEGVFRAWGMGAPRFYEGRYGWMVRFPESRIPSYEATAWSALQTTHLIVAGYQVRLLQADIVPNERHPFVPPHLWPDSEEEANGDGGNGHTPTPPDHEPSRKPAQGDGSLIAI